MHICISLRCSEMLAAGLLNEGNARTRAMARFAPSDSPRSVQLYGVDPAQVGILNLQNHALQTQVYQALCRGSSVGLKTSLQSSRKRCNCICIILLTAFCCARASSAAAGRVHAAWCDDSFHTCLKHVLQVRQAAAWLVGHGAQHIDLNFGWVARSQRTATAQSMANAH